MDDGAIDDFFAPLGPVSIRRMFGGKGIYFEGRIVALEVSGELLLKADGETAPAFAAAGARQWIYPGRARSVAMPYWTIPESAIDEPDERLNWLEMARDASLRAGAKPKKEKKKRAPVRRAPRSS